MFIPISELEGFTYPEYINLKNGLIILQNFPKIVSNLQEKRRKKIEKKMAEFDFTQTLKKMCKSNSPIIHTNYKFSKCLGSYGRLFAKSGSLQNLPREFRMALGTNYRDVDIVNCHPTILYQYCIKNGIKCDILHQYINNRDEILSKIMLDHQLERGDAKDLFLKIMNGGIVNMGDDFLYDFKQEIKLIHKNICGLNPELLKAIKSKKDYNVNGSMMNVVLCKIENEILLTAVQYLKSLGYNVDVLVFDGFMVRKEDGKDLNEELFKKLSEYIKEKTGYDIKFIEKSMTQEIDLSVYTDPLLEIPAEISYYKDKEEFEKTHIKIISDANFIDILSDGTMIRKTEDKMITAYKHLKSTIKDDKGNIVKASFIKNWLEDENIRRYEKTVFIPPPQKYNSTLHYNTWQPMKPELTPLPNNFDINTNEYVLMYKEFISNLFNGEKEFINYYDAWCANIIQNPSNRTCVCVVLYSHDEGVGKNMSTKTLELCVGTNYTFYISDVANQLFGKHSAPELERLLIVLNEVKGKDTYANTDLFKTRITDNDREIELKGKDAIVINNYCSYILNTNNANAVNAGMKDRRFCILPCTNKKIDDKEYFEEYSRKINQNPEAIRCIYEYLKSYDIEKIVPKRLFQKYRPSSEIYKDLTESNREKEWYLIKEIVYENRLYSSLKIKMSEVWNAYKLYCIRNNHKLNLTDRRFYLQISAIIIKELSKYEEYKDAFSKYESNSISYYKINITKMRKYFNITEDDENED